MSRWPTWTSWPPPTACQCGPAVVVAYLAVAVSLPAVVIGAVLSADDAIEPAELPGLLIDWIDSDHAQLPASLRRSIGNDACDTTSLRTDLARFQFLRGGDEQPHFGTSDL